MTRIRSLLTVGALIGTVLASASAGAAMNYSFSGNFFQDDEVQLFNFTAGGDSQITLRTWSYAGGVNAAGESIARGGFDPILALFDGSGNYIDQNDDGGCSLVAEDSVTGQCWDTYFSATLAAGNYTVAIMQYDNFAIGPNLSDGFARDGQGSFTADWCPASQFCDVANDARLSHWAFDILGVEAAEQVGGNDTSEAPEPASLALLGLGLAGIAAVRRRRS